MTRKEAIKVLIDELDYEVEYEGDSLKGKALKMAISALRAQQTIHVTDLYDEDGGEVYQDKQDVPVTDVGKNDPLTLDELRQMDGEPVWVKHYNGGEWVIVNWNIYGRIYAARNAALRADEYGERWHAYRRKPEEDDHDCFEAVSNYDCCAKHEKRILHWQGLCVVV